MTDDVCSEGAATGGVALRIHAGEASRVATKWGLGVWSDPAVPAAGPPWIDAAYGDGRHIASAGLDDGDDDDYDDDYDDDEEDEEDDDLLDDEDDEDDLLDDEDDEDEDDDL